MGGTVLNLVFGKRANHNNASQLPSIAKMLKLTQVCIHMLHPNKEITLKVTQN